MRQLSNIRTGLLLAILFFAGAQLFPPANAQGLGKFERDIAEAMLEAMKSDLKKNYYDPQFRGMDVDARFSQAKQKLHDATTRDQLMVIVAQTLLDLNDSHTMFAPPARAAKIEYGWEMRMIGDTAHVIAVKPKSDADAKGLKPGDAILAVDGYRPSRENIWKMYYRYYSLMPARGMKLMVQSPGADQPREVEVLANIVRTAKVTDWEKVFVGLLREEWDLYQDRGFEFGKDVLIWQMPTFEVSDSHIDAIAGKAKNYQSLIIDLRGNGGGYVKTLERLTGYFFDKDVTIATVKGRKEEKPMVAKTRGKDSFTGKLIVLIDSDSGSASEIFARTIQLEKRGVIVGDRSAGAVMQSRFFDHQSGVGNVLYYGANITVADVIMSDGKSLENVGVVPDELVLPTGADLAAQRDPALAHAAGLVGLKIDAEKAGTLFPKEWK